MYVIFRDLGVEGFPNGTSLFLREFANKKESKQYSLNEPGDPANE